MAHFKIAILIDKDVRRFLYGFRRISAFAGVESASLANKVTMHNPSGMDIFESSLISELALAFEESCRLSNVQGSDTGNTG